MVLSDVAIFMRIVELGSLTAAARSLRLSITSASARLTQLETQIGARLVNRTTRRLKPTDVGLAFYEHALEVFAAVERAENSVAEMTGVAVGTLRVTAPLAFGRRVLAPLIAAFHRQHPRIEIRLRSSDVGVDMLAENIDLAIRTAPMPDSSFIVRKLADGPRVLCAAPAYLQRRGRPEHPDDLSDHHCLLLRFPGSTDFRWEFEGPAGPSGVAVSGRFDSDSGEILTDWALQGEGIVLKPYWEVASYLKTGDLEQVLPNHSVKPLAINLVYPSRSLLPPKTRLFADFLVEQVKLLVEQPDAASWHRPSERGSDARQ